MTGQPHPDEAVRRALGLLSVALRSREPWTDQCQHALDEGFDALAALVADRERLKEYAAHKATCVLSYSRSPLRTDDWCTCGLVAVLARVSPPAGLPKEEDE